MRKISKNEFLEHFEDEEFLKVYGEPVLVEDENGSSLVCLSKELYQNLTRDLSNENIEDMADEGWLERFIAEYYSILRNFSESNCKAIKELAMTNGICREKR